MPSIVTIARLALLKAMELPHRAARYYVKVSPAFDLLVLFMVSRPAFWYASSLQT
jgi:hypothetical protein